RGGDHPAPLADRAGPRRAYAGGDRGLDRRRAHPASLGRQRAPADGHGRTYPPGITVPGRRFGDRRDATWIPFHSMGTRHAGAPPGLLLGGGEGRRLGMPKALVEIGGERLTDRGVRMLHEAGCTPIVVVTGAARVDVAGAVVVHNPDWRTGMGSSLRVGLSAL